MPAPDVAVGDRVEVTIYCTTGNQVAVNVLHYQIDSIGGAVPAYDEVPGRIYVHVEDQYRAWLGEQANFAGVGIRRLGPGAQSIQFNSIDEVPGEESGNLMPWQVAGLLSFRSQLTGPAGRGRAYIPFPSAIYGDASGNLTETGLIVLDAIGEKLGPSVSWTGVAAAWTVGATLRTGPGVSAYDIDRVFATGKWATQRRRGNYGRPNALPS